MWTNDVVLLLIDLFKSYEFLWDTSNNDYKNRKKKDETWEKIATIMKLPKRDIESKMHNLRSQFAREKRRTTAAKKSQWFAYESLRFLEKGESTSDEVDIDKERSLSQDSHSTRNTDDNLADREIETCDTNESKRIRNNEAVENKRKWVQYAVSDGDSDDDIEIYGRYITSELRKIKTDHALVMTKYFINNIIMEARTGKYDKDTNQHGYCTVVSNPSRPQASTSRMSPYDDQNPLSPSSEASEQEDVKPCISYGTHIFGNTSPAKSGDFKRHRLHD